MITFRLPLRGVYDSITRPVSLNVLDDLKQVLYLNRAMRTKLYNQVESFNTMSQNGPLGLSENAPKMEEIKFTVEENTNTDTLITTSSNYIDYIPILHDKEINAYVKPIYVESEIKFSIKYKTKSKTNAGNFINMLRLSAAESNFVLYHNIEYMFYIPPEILELFLDISLLKHNVTKDNTNYEDYLIKHSDGRLSIVGGLDGNTNNMNIVAKERQRDVVGYFESDIIDTKESYDENETTWIAEFNYTLKYNKPISIVVSYPILVYNQVLPEKYLVMADLLGDKGKQNFPTTIMNDNFNIFNNTNVIEREMNKLNVKNGFLNIPNFDLWKPKLGIPYYTPIFSVLVMLSPEDLRSLLNLKDLSDYELNNDILDCLLKGEWQYICKRYKSIFYLTLYENDKLIADGVINIDADLNVFANRDLDLTKTYRVVFSILTDLAAADKNILDRMYKCDKVYNLALKALSIKNTSLNKRLNKTDMIILYNAKNAKLNRYTVMVNTILSFIGKDN